MMQDRNQVQEALSQISNEFEAVKGSTASALVDQENALREQKEVRRPSLILPLPCHCRPTAIYRQRQ